MVDISMFFDDLPGLLRVVIVSVSAYVALVLILRVSGKRTLSKLSAFDLVVTVALGSTLATVLLSSDVALAEGVLALAMLALLQWVVAIASVRFRWVKGLVRSRPRLLVCKGEYLHAALRDERVTVGEVDQAIRSQGIGRLGEVDAVVLETDGSFSVIKRGDEGELTALRSVNQG